ncbi:MAG: ATP-dependent zinc metalloprotease FtsH [Alkalibacterium gilvum]|uniref:ATP-dependent zinc metalloprotease FtsH n=1 Tax=Alkalibacterium gilvum TaxID=1130080 RepID=UPI003F8DABB7
MKKGFFKSGLFYVIVFLAVIGIASWATSGGQDQASEGINSTEFIEFLEDDRIEEFQVQPTAGVYEITGQLRKGQEIEIEDDQNVNFFGSGEQEDASSFSTYILRNDTVVDEMYKLAKENDVEISSVEEPSTGIWTSLLFSFLPLLLFVGIIYFMMGQAGQGGGGGGGRGVMNFGKSKAKESSAKTSKVRFSDVAGADEEKEELVEIVEFLKDPRRFSNLGARIPAGVLLEGPPGTGKTLLAKAVAGEAGVPFFSISGSEFVEMFVGVGASRVRDLFENAKKTAPAIIFIDEIDAVGRQRGAGMGGGHDEREQTLNQLLVEMDGFTGNEGVIVIAATNRQDVLDPALLRPGRFDRRIMVGRPDVKGREAILKVHSKNKPIGPDVDMKVIARQTPGFSGADLENLLNESALVAARRDSKKIEAIDIDEAHDRVIAGPAKKDRVISKVERSMVAYHEAGHTIVGLVLSDARIVHKVTIVPRGRAGGYAIMLPREDRFLMTKKELFEQIVGLLGGRVAEEIIFDSQSSGASNDFQQATQIARSMVTQYGMSDLLGPVQYEGDGGQVFLGRDYSQSKAYSEQFAYQIDQEVLRILNEALAEARRILEEHKDAHALIAKKLLEVETLDEKQIKSLFEKGEMPTKEVSAASEFPSEKEDTEEETEEEIGKTFEEIKATREKKERERERHFAKNDDDEPLEGLDELENSEISDDDSDKDKTEKSKDEH